MRYFCNDDIRGALRDACAGLTQKEWADQYGVAPSYLSDFLNGRRDASPSILRALGFDPMHYYRKAEK